MATALLALLLAAAPMFSQSPAETVLGADWHTSESSFGYRRLYTDCQPVTAYASVGDDAAEAGVNPERLEHMMESRLRAARLFQTGEEDPSLAVLVGAHKGNPVTIFDVQVRFWRRMVNPVTGTEVPVTVWQSGDGGHFGSHGSPDQIVNGIVSSRLDEFILDYLKVNDCDSLERRQP